MLIRCAVLALFGLSACTTAPPSELDPPRHGTARIASFNTSLHFDGAGELAQALYGGDYLPAKKVAAIIQAVAPDVILLNEFDYQQSGSGLRIFREQYLERPQFNQRAIVYSFVYAAPVNTGLSSGVDLNGDGAVTVPADAHGWGEYFGKYGMAVLSRWPLDGVRTFQQFRWIDMPQPSWPSDPQTGSSYYSDAAKRVLRLSSKSHWDLPVTLPDGRTLHLLASHPTPPVFDGPEDRNGARNADEIRFWVDYISGADYMYDDAGRRGGLAPAAAFVIAGDLNADPFDGDGRRPAIASLLGHRRIAASPVPASTGGIKAALDQGGANDRHRGDPGHDTGDFNDAAPGNLRLDYVLPSSDLQLLKAGVFWPRPGESGADWIGVSDHRLVWIDIELTR